MRNIILPEEVLLYHIWLSIIQLARAKFDGFGGVPLYSRLPRPPWNFRSHHEGLLRNVGVSSPPVLAASLSSVGLSTNVLSID